VLGLFFSFLLRRLPREPTGSKALAGPFNILVVAWPTVRFSGEFRQSGASKAYESVRAHVMEHASEKSGDPGVSGAWPRLARHAATPNPVRSGADGCVPVRVQMGFLAADWSRVCADGDRFGQYFAAYSD
jgi:hypothetical protein